MGRRKAGRRVKKRTQKASDTADTSATDLPPRAFVFTKGKVPAKLKALVSDLKRVMSPNTASHLKAQKRNKLRDFVDVAGSLHVSFFLIVSATAKSAYLRLVRSPRGPTLTFKIDGYSLAADLAASVRRPYSPGHSIWQSAPMLVLSNFDKTIQHEALSATMLQNLFPTLNVATARLAAFRRVVLVHQLPESEGGGAQLRQYVIKAAPTGVSRGVKKLARASKVPSLGRYGDVADFLTGGGFSSDSGGETDDEEKAELPQDYHGRHAKKSQRVSIKLQEVGPRLSLSLLKVEEGLCDGATLYHKFVQKSEEDAAETAAKIEARKALKEERKATQAANVQRKREALEAKESKRKRRRGPYGSDAGDSQGGGDDDEDDDEDEDDEDMVEGDDDYEYGDGGDAAADGYDDDQEYYREAVGEDPDAALGLLSASDKLKKHGAKRKEPPSESKKAAAKAPAMKPPVKKKRR